MTYDVLFPFFVDLDELKRNLARIFDINVTEVDVWPEDHLGDRNWDAKVTCDYSEKGGDLALRVEVYASKEILAPPGVEEFSLERV